MRHLAMIALVLATLTPAASQGQTEENRGSAGYLLQLCKTWLDYAEEEEDTVQNMGRTEPARLAVAGVCIGFVIGVLETLRSIKLSCPPKDATNSQIVQTVLSEIEKHPERMQEDCVVPVLVAMMNSWPCPRKRSSSEFGRKTGMPLPPCRRSNQFGDTVRGCAELRQRSKRPR